MEIVAEIVLIIGFVLMISKYIAYILKMDKVITIQKKMLQEFQNRKIKKRLD